MRLPDGIGNFARRRGAIAMAWFDKNAGGKKGSDQEPEPVSERLKPVLESTPASGVPVPKAAAKVEPAPATDGLIGYLYKGSRVTGQLSFQGPVRIDGIVEGDIHCQGALTIGES